MISRMTRIFRQWWCNHDPVKKIDGLRITMHCQNCGHETKGWTLDCPAPTQRFGKGPYAAIQRHKNVRHV